MKRRRGFTIIELPAVIAIIGILIGLLLPAVQNVRDNANRNAAENALARIGVSANAYFAQTHAFPVSLEQLVPFGLNPELATGRYGGFLFAVVQHTGFPPFQVRATPAVPGKTGVDTCTIDNTSRLECSATPGAITAQHVMFLRLAALAAGELSNLILALETSAATEDQIKDYLAGSSTVGDVFAAFDTNHDGAVTPAEIFSFATVNTNPPAATSPTLLGGFLAAGETEMALGAANEHIFSLPGVRLADLPQRYCSQTGEAGLGPCLIFPDPEAPHKP